MASHEISWMAYSVFVGQTINIVEGGTVEGGAEFRIVYSVLHVLSCIITMVVLCKYLFCLNAPTAVRVHYHSSLLRKRYAT